MVDRFLVWLGTGVVTAGVTAAMLAGAGVAIATDGASSDGGGATTSESSNSPESKNDSGAGQPSAKGPDANGEDDKADDAAGDESDADDPAGDAEETTDEDAVDEDATDEDATDDTTGEDLTDGTTDEGATETNEEVGELADSVDGTGNGTGSRSNDVQLGDSQTLLNQTVGDDLGIAAKTTGEDGEKNAAAIVGNELETAEEQAVVPLATAFEEMTEQKEDPELMAVAFAAPATAPVNALATAPPLNILLDIIGTVVFGLFSLITQTVGGPPMLPPGSTVTVLSSRLRIDCGCAPGEGEEVPVDWYIPENPEPGRLIYLQHGFLAASPWYSYTAAALAEQTNSIVVAPSITSNFLSYDQCWLGGAPMHQAMAGLFADGNTALAESASAAGYDNLTWNRVVLMGHSLGGGAVSGIAGYMTENGSADRLAGVVLLDGVGLNGRMVDDLKKVDLDIPIYQLAAPKYMWNMFGSGTDALLQARPTADFYGVTLVGGSHVDTMRGGNFLIQFAQQLVSGFSKPQNVAAAEILMVGWVNDMFDDKVVSPSADPDDLYLENGQTLMIGTPAGQATLVDLPNSLRKPFILNFLEPFMALSGGLFTLQPGCLREPTATAASCSDSVAA
ncbi:MAG: alpha/beta hydrolase family protein [Mycobacterium sp.]